MERSSVYISESAQKKIFNVQHNFKSLGQLYGLSEHQTSYRFKKLKEDKSFREDFGTKKGSLSYNQKYMLYDEWGEVPEDE
jgi:ABC-type Na+ transport system ATPase subunit NatA